MNARSVGARRTRDANRITAVFAGAAALACVGSLIPGVNTAIGVVLGVGAAAVLAAAVWWSVARRLRERREDAADALTAARWRALNAPHLLTDADRRMLAAAAVPDAAPVHLSARAAALPSDARSAA